MTLTRDDEEHSAQVYRLYTLLYQKLKHRGLDLDNLPRYVSRKYWGDILRILVKDNYPNLTTVQQVQMVQSIMRSMKADNPED